MKTLCLIVWMLLTLILAFSLVGMFLLTNQTIHYKEHAPDIHRSTWMEIGIRLLDSIIENKSN